MSTSLLLDGLLVLIVLLFVPIGLWRGGIKEVLVASSILLGAAIAELWARPWGTELANRADMREQVAQFLVAITILVLTVIVIGYGGGVALGARRVSIEGRVVGGLLAWLNGMLLLGFTFTFVDRYFLEGRPNAMIDGSIIASALIHQFGWFLLAGVAMLVPCIGIGIMLNLARRDDIGFLDDEMYETDLVPPPRPTVRQRSVRMPHAADEGKFEPLRQQFDATTGRSAADAPRPTRDATMPVSVPAPPTGTWPAPPDRADNGAHASPSGNGAPAGEEVVREWLRRGAAMSRPQEQEQDSDASSAPAPETDAPSPSRAARWPSRTCAACGASVPGTATHCPECGELT